MTTFDMVKTQNAETHTDLGPNFDRRQTSRGSQFGSTRSTSLPDPLLPCSGTLVALTGASDLPRSACSPELEDLWGNTWRFGLRFPLYPRSPKRGKQTRKITVWVDAVAAWRIRPLIARRVTCVSRDDRR